jgi:hypothetical protein
MNYFFKKRTQCHLIRRHDDLDRFPENVAAPERLGAAQEGRRHVEEALHDVVVAAVDGEEVEERKSLLDDLRPEVSDPAQLQRHVAGQRALGGNA